MFPVRLLSLLSVALLLAVASDARPSSLLPRTERWVSNTGLTFDLSPYQEGPASVSRRSASQGNSSVATLNGGGFISGRLTKYKKTPTETQARRRAAAPPTGLGPAVEDISFQWPKEIACNDNHAGDSAECGKAFWTDYDALYSSALADSAGDGKWKHCSGNCCAVAKGPKQPNVGDIVKWARNAYGACVGPNLSTYRSAVQQSYDIGNLGSFKMCMCHDQSIGSC